jgi:hypothetical protein
MSVLDRYALGSAAICIFPRVVVPWALRLLGPATCVSAPVGARAAGAGAKEVAGGRRARILTTITRATATVRAHRSRDRRNAFIFFFLLSLPLSLDPEIPAGRGSAMRLVGFELPEIALELP